MRTRLVLLCAIAVAGCTRSNPAFDTPTETEGQTEGPADTSPEESAEDAGLGCDLQGGPGMYIEVPPPCPPPDVGPNAGVYDRWFKVVGVESGNWIVESCDPDCMNCEDLIPSPLIVDPIPLGDLAGDGTCLHVTGRRLGEGSEDCEYHTLVVQAAAGSNSTTVLLARNTALLELPDVDPNSGPGVSAFNPMLQLVDNCPCNEYPDDCCDGQTPTLYEFDIGAGENVSIGATVAHALDQRPFDFWALDAFQPGDCNEPLGVAWALSASN